MYALFPVRVIAVILIAGFSIQSTSGELPVIEWSAQSPLTSRPMYIHIYADGRVLLPNKKKPVFRQLTPSDVERLLVRIKSEGFFELDQESVNRRIASAAGRVYQKGASNKVYPPGETIIDGAVSTVGVRTVSATNAVSLFAPAIYAKEYPQIEELQVFQKAVALINQAATGKTNVARHRDK